MGWSTTIPYHMAWAIAFNSPFALSKQVSDFGGTRNGTIIHWPNRIKKVVVCTQFSHVNDVAPTILGGQSADAEDHQWHPADSDARNKFDVYL